MRLSMFSKSFAFEPFAGFQRVGFVAPEEEGQRPLEKSEQIEGLTAKVA